MVADPAWDLLVARDDLSRIELVEREYPALSHGEVLLRCDRVGMTANNITYAVTGDALGYWQFFPAPQGWGRVPLWGFADVESSRAPGVVPGDRLYGYLPTSSHLVVRVGRADDRGLRDISPHRAGLPAAYNRYARTATDPAYSAEHEDLQVLFRPLFITSFMLDDYLADNGWFGADTVVVSSASSKTAYGAAFLIREREPRPELVALTSADNCGFTEALGCYDRVLAYEDVAQLEPGRPSAYVDVSGNAELRSAVTAHLGDRLVRDLLVGASHHDQLGKATEHMGPASKTGGPSFFFAPDQLAKRSGDWGPGGIEARHAAAWTRFLPFVERQVDVRRGSGPADLREAWLEVLGGRSAPRTGHVIVL